MRDDAEGERQRTEKYDVRREDAMKDDLMMWNTSEKRDNTKEKTEGGRRRD